MALGGSERVGQLQGQNRHQRDWSRAAASSCQGLDTRGAEQRQEAGSCPSHWRWAADGGPFVCLLQHLDCGYPSAELWQVWCLVPSFSSHFKPRHYSSKPGLMNHCERLTCWQLHATQLHILFCCHNFKKLLEQCPPTTKKKKKYPQSWELICNPPPVYLYQAVWVGLEISSSCRAGFSQEIKSLAIIYPSR